MEFAPAMADDAPFLPGLSPIAGRQVAFDAGRLTSDGGVLVLAEIEHRLGIAERLARCIEDPQAPERIQHTLAEMIGFRALLIAAGYEDGNDCDALRADPAFKLAVGRLEASPQGSDSRFIVTNLAGARRWLYESVYCQRGQAENLIKAHKLHLASDRTSCTSATANQFRLLSHTAACWLLHTLRGLAPKTSFRRAAQLDTIRLALIKVAARVTEMKTRIKVALPSCYPHQASRALLAARAVKLPPRGPGQRVPPERSLSTPNPTDPRPWRHPAPRSDTASDARCPRPS
jgi:Transposase DDE domain group 1